MPAVETGIGDSFQSNLIRLFSDNPRQPVLVILYLRSIFAQLILSGGRLRSEEDLPPLHHVRLLLETAGLLTTDG